MISSSRLLTLPPSSAADYIGVPGELTQADQIEAQTRQDLVIESGMMQYLTFLLCATLLMPAALVQPRKTLLITAQPAHDPIHLPQYSPYHVSYCFIISPPRFLHCCT